MFVLSSSSVKISNIEKCQTHPCLELSQKFHFPTGSRSFTAIKVLQNLQVSIDKILNDYLTNNHVFGFSSGGQWNSGGSCDSETEPIKNDTYLLPYPWKMRVFEKVIKGMKTPISYLNVTKMTDYRKDGHPSRYRKHSSLDLQVQDCSHWCLPGVPDLWNELLYAELLRKQYKDRQQKIQT